ncbi:MAG: DUF423 domain-containing protein [Bacteroidetes bacterium]|nr:DUF423 domain-containing protein [Bacteroidota bacterium]
MKYIITGAIILAFAVALGAFGAHGLKSLIEEDSLKTFETGVRYQFYHAFGVVICGILNVVLNSNKFKAPFVWFVSGIILFSGSLYILCFREYLENLKYIGMITPIGGICFIIGWLRLAYILFRLPNEKAI